MLSVTCPLGDVVLNRMVPLSNPRVTKTIYSVSMPWVTFFLESFALRKYLAYKSMCMHVHMWYKVQGHYRRTYLRRVQFGGMYYGNNS